jgi:four helix bundle protein
MKPHKNLEAWKQSFSLVKDLYLATGSFPPEEKFGLVSQLRRAAVSIPTNIAEGAARRSKKEFLHFLYISEGSLSETDTLLSLSIELNFGEKSLLEALILRLENISKLIVGLIRKIEKDIL